MAKRDTDGIILKSLPKKKTWTWLIITLAFQLSSSQEKSGNMKKSRDKESEEEIR